MRKEKGGGKGETMEIRRTDINGSKVVPASDKSEITDRYFSRKVAWVSG